MSRRSEGIVCRRCGARFPLAERNCPECGTAVRSRLGSAVVVAIGLLVLYISLSPFDLFSAVIGAILVGVGLSAFRDRRRRLREARERRAGPASRSAE